MIETFTTFRVVEDIGYDIFHHSSNMNESKGCLHLTTPKEWNYNSLQPQKVVCFGSFYFHIWSCLVGELWQCGLHHLSFPRDVFFYSWSWSHKVSHRSSGLLGYFPDVVIPKLHSNYISWNVAGYITWIALLGPRNTWYIWIIAIASSWSVWI